ncbi:MAG: tetratricopeptide repeat protein [Chloroflexota bacterium]
MIDTLLQTKLFIPQLRTSIVPRQNLIKQLNKGLDSRLTLVSAPAGFGKTTIVIQWIHSCELPIGWLSLDERDGEPQQFLAYLVAALETVAGQSEIAPQTTARLQSQPPPAPEEILTVLLNELAAFTTPFMLVLDDYHRITSPAIDDLLAFLIEHMPPQMHMVITTREDPQLPLSRLRARGQMTELRVADLRFSSDEAAGFLNQGMGLSLSAENVTALELRTEGWIAGLQLAALALQTNQADTDKNTFIETFTGGHHFVLDYLVEEVLANQPDDVRNFLLQTAILKRLSGPLCDAVTGESNSKTVLNHLLHDNLFLIPLDNTRRWFRYHHLFAEVLQTRLLEEHSDRVKLLHQRASDWHAQQGNSTEAIEHAFATNDDERAANLLEVTWRERDRTFQALGEWLRWTESLPDEVVYARPVLSVGYAWALLNDGRFEGAEAHLQAAERAVESAEIIVNDQAKFKLLTFSIASARAYFAQAVGDIPGTMKYAQQALDLLPQDDHIQRAIPLALLSLGYRASGELDRAYQMLSDSMDAFLESGSVMLAISGVFAMADMRSTQGRLHDAIQLYQNALQLVEQSDDPTMRGKANLHLGLSELHREQGDIEAADQHWQKIPPLNDLDWAFQQRWAAAQAQAEQRRGNFAMALRLFDEAIKRSEQVNIADLKPAAAMKARLNIVQGNLAAAGDWARQHRISSEDTLSYLHEYEHVTLARLRLAEGAFDEALRLLERLAVSAENGGRIDSLIEIQLLQALTHHAQGNKAQAVDVLAKALISAEPQGYLQRFITEGEPVAELSTTLQAAINSHFGTNSPRMQVYIQKLLAAFSVSQPILTPPDIAQTLLDPLSERELDVLRLLPADLSGPQIANELMVSLNTFRTHTKNIYSKLGVNNRRAAVRRAAELSLL